MRARPQPGLQPRSADSPDAGRRGTALAGKLPEGRFLGVGAASYASAPPCRRPVQEAVPACAQPANGFESWATSREG